MSNRSLAMTRARLKQKSRAISIKYAADELRKDRKIVLTAMLNHPGALVYCLDEDLKQELQGLNRPQLQALLDLENAGLPARAPDEDYVDDDGGGDLPTCLMCFDAGTKCASCRLLDANVHLHASSPHPSEPDNVGANDANVNESPMPSDELLPHAETDSLDLTLTPGAVKKKKKKKKKVSQSNIEKSARTSSPTGDAAVVAEEISHEEEEEDCDDDDAVARAVPFHGELLGGWNVNGEAAAAEAAAAVAAAEAACAISGFCDVTAFDKGAIQGRESDSRLTPAFGSACLLSSDADGCAPENALEATLQVSVLESHFDVGDASQNSNSDSSCEIVGMCSDEANGSSGGGNGAVPPILAAVLSRYGVAKAEHGALLSDLAAALRQSSPFVNSDQFKELAMHL